MLVVWFRKESSRWGRRVQCLVASSNNLQEENRSISEDVTRRRLHCAPTGKEASQEMMP
jgi:hypothetical protein